MKRYLMAGLTALAGVALFEAALIPGVAIGAAAVLAPRLLQRKPRRGPRPLSSAAVRRRIETQAFRPAGVVGKAGPAAPARFANNQAIAKTITFRVIVTTLDFTSNYVVIGELTTAAGLSAFALVVGPVFYLAHEAAWDYFGPPGSVVGVPIRLPLRSGANAPPADRRGFAVSRALAKTITFRTVATVMDFTAHYVVVGNLATAVGLSAFGFVVGPFVYYGHEKAWDYYNLRRDRTLALPAPAEPAPDAGIAPRKPKGTSERLEE